MICILPNAILGAIRGIKKYAQLQHPSLCPGMSLNLRAHNHTFFSFFEMQKFYVNLSKMNRPGKTDGLKIYLASVPTKQIKNIHRQEA